MSNLHRDLRRKGYSKQKAFKITGTAKRLSKKNMNSRWKKGKFNRYKNLDFDGDGKVNKYDCYPFDYQRQGILANLKNFFFRSKEMRSQDKKDAEKAGLSGLSKARFLYKRSKNRAELAKDIKRMERNMKNEKILLKAKSERNKNKEGFLTISQAKINVLKGKSKENQRQIRKLNRELDIFNRVNKNLENRGKTPKVEFYGQTYPIIKAKKSKPIKLSRGGKPKVRFYGKEYKNLK